MERYGNARTAGIDDGGGHHGGITRIGALHGDRTAAKVDVLDVMSRRHDDRITGDGDIDRGLNGIEIRTGGR